MHVLPQLRKLEAQFHDELVVIGVHSGKYPNERRTPHIEHAALRLDVEHPILNDRKYRTWRMYGISAWPTLVLIDPQGRVLGGQPGETTAEQWAPVLEELIAQYDAQGLIDRRPLAFAPLQATEPARPLRYPDKLLADDQGRLFIADSGHHRIVVARIEGQGLQVTKIIGSGQQGHADGDAATAMFNHPRGLARHGDTLYVADTENHLIRAVDLVTNSVTTVAGTGRRGASPSASGPGPQIGLASPWDLVMHDGKLIIAMAGLHQLWQLDPANGYVAPLAGTGHETIEDGPLRSATLAQPCGITSDSSEIFFADSESQAIRRATTGNDGSITTIVGTGLFDFGDADGIGDKVLLQHPQAVVAHAGLLYVADSYNHRIKIVDPATREARSWLGGRRIPGHVDGAANEAAFYEPGGLSVGGDTLWIADTNNHAIRAADLQTGDVRTVAIEGLSPVSR
ncbi:MAG TPA: thioredoxin-like domain-containing protein [Herpetosiphonaceae bacterium]